MPRYVLILLALLVLLVTACSPLPRNPTERALYQDLRKIVETRERGEWMIEYAEVERATPKAMQSVCQVDSARVRDLSSWITSQIEQKGGSPEEQFEDGVPLRKLREELSLGRTRAVLRSAEDKRDRCPFYLRPSDDFRGVHQTTSRFVLLGESVATVSTSIRGNSVFTGAGGAGRLMPAWGVSHRLLVGIGAEVGGTAGLSPLSGDEDQELETRVQGSVPLLLRFSDLATIIDLEVAATGVTSPTKPAPDWGFRASVAGGVSTVRINKLLPYFTVMVAYQYFPWTNPRTHMILAGTRIGFAFDP